MTRPMMLCLVTLAACLPDGSHPQKSPDPRVADKTQDDLKRGEEKAQVTMWHSKYVPEEVTVYCQAVDGFKSCGTVHLSIGGARRCLGGNLARFEEDTQKKFGTPFNDSLPSEMVSSATIQCLEREADVYAREQQEKSKAGEKELPRLTRIDDIEDRLDRMERRIKWLKRQLKNCGK